jgi:hypothetical protein
MVPELFGVIGSDRCLTPADAERDAVRHPLTDAAWNVYQKHFRCFTGASLDPQFHRLHHPATRTGGITMPSDETVIVVGTGPSLTAQLDALKRNRAGLRLFTSPRGAEVLLARGIVPDLVLIEHQTALDAHHSARHLGDGRDPVLGKCPLVAADWRTPRAQLTGVGPWSLFVPSALPTWGLWPATAAALAVNAGVARIGLLGIDLGTADSPDPAHAPLRAVLELLARLVSASTFDCGAGSARKEGWTSAAVHQVTGAAVQGPIETNFYLAPDRQQRHRQAREALAELAPVIQRASRLRSLALQARSRPHHTLGSSLEAGVTEVIGWRQDPRVRALIQEALGASFLPRFWRIGIDLSLGDALWRPLLLATHELTAQADALSSAVAAARAA